MAEFDFFIPSEHKAEFDEIINSTPLKFLCSANRSDSGWAISLNSLGGRQNETLEFVNLLKSRGLIP